MAEHHSYEQRLSGGDRIRGTLDGLHLGSSGCVTGILVQRSLTCRLQDNIALNARIKVT